LNIRIQKNSNKKMQDLKNKLQKCVDKVNINGYNKFKLNRFNTTMY
jgi:hypothetical protein